MAAQPDWSLHASVQQHGDDVSLRVSLTAYDTDGTELGHNTWRGREQRLPILESSEDTAWYLLLLLVQVLERAGSVGRVTARVDPTLF